MVGNKSQNLDKFKKIRHPDYCSTCCVIRSKVEDHDRAHKLICQGNRYAAWKYLKPKYGNLRSKGFPIDYLLEDGTTINPKYLLKEEK